MAGPRKPAQHNDSVDPSQKRADEGEVKRNSASAPANPHQGKGNDERGTYGRTKPSNTTTPV